MSGLVAGFGCGAEEKEVQPEASGLHAPLPTLNTFINDSLQIDELDNPPLGNGPGDANLILGNDPPPNGSASVDLPTGGPATFIDWDDLAGDAANHVLVDTNAPGTNEDHTAFPLSNECVAPKGVLDKMDITFVASANNQTYVYLAVQRAANSGDAGYYWLFTKLPPTFPTGTAECGAKHRLLYDISVGDVLLAGHFHPSAQPLLTVYTANSAAADVDAVSAIDFTHPRWTLNANGVAAAAVNTTVAKTGSAPLNAAGVKSNAMTGGNLGVELFAEAAVPLTVFTGQNGACGAQFWGSVITRSSGSGGTSPDLKDLAGPAQFNFGQPAATGRLKPSCDLNAEFELLTATGADGQPIGNPQCHWEFDDGATFEGCSGVHPFAAGGAHTATLTVTDAGCGSDPFTTPAVTYHPALGCTATITGSCASSFDYSSTISGGSGSVTYAWTFSGPGNENPSGSTSASGPPSVAVDAAGTYAGNLVVTDTRTDIQCTASCSDDDPVFLPLAINLTPQVDIDACASDAVTYTAHVENGSGNTSVTWHGAASGCVGSQCTINPSNDLFCVGPLTLWATAVDNNGICANAQSENETYEKETILTVTNNPAP